MEARRTQNIIQLEDGYVDISNEHFFYEDTEENFYKDYPEFGKFENTFVMYNQTLKTYVVGSDIQHSRQFEFKNIAKYDNAIADIRKILENQWNRNHKDMSADANPYTEHNN